MATIVSESPIVNPSIPNRQSVNRKSPIRQSPIVDPSIVNRKSSFENAYRLTEMMTVLRNASPMLSEDIWGSSATVR